MIANVSVAAFFVAITDFWNALAVGAFLCCILARIVFGALRLNVRNAMAVGAGLCFIFARIAFGALGFIFRNAMAIGACL